ncbi:hypothetical protein JP75_23910 [Devosia riboflavina]|uniref:Uncharacterized protein n=2 Tax=Devosia riboflavina TaxID=46914 RepID=A0A087LWN4_9HYPH|nr:hypothetical protein JP75_23910 [Devosia riboflavina]
MTINGVAVSEADMPAVQERCDALSTAESTEALSEGNETEEANNVSGETDTSEADAPAVNEGANATTTIDLDTIDLQACVDGGFVTQ